MAAATWAVAAVEAAVEVAAKVVVVAVVVAAGRRAVEAAARQAFEGSCETGDASRPCRVRDSEGHGCGRQARDNEWKRVRWLGSDGSFDVCSLATAVIKDENPTNHLSSPLN